MSDRLPARRRAYRLRVTEDHIREGAREDGRACAGALAVLAAFPGLVRVNVTLHHVHAWGEGDRYWTWDHDAREWVQDFDQGRPVSPVTVALRPHR